MILSEARRFTEKYAEQTVKDVVITVPPYFNQAERRAMATAVNISGLNLLQVSDSFVLFIEKHYELLQLINDNTAAGLNYGVFRRKDINETAQTLLVFDMGAAKTTATIFEYRMVKDKAIGETNPQVYSFSDNSVLLFWHQIFVWEFFMVPKTFKLKHFR